MSNQKFPKFTPGPWAVADFGHGRLMIYSEGPPLAPAAAIICKDDETVANAYLIAAAPDLLKMLKQCEEVLVLSGGHEGGIFLEEVRMAIFKAERSERLP